MYMQICINLSILGKDVIKNPCILFSVHTGMSKAAVLFPNVGEVSGLDRPQEPRGLLTSC